MASDPSSSSIAFTGSCQCGSVRYSSTSPPQTLTYCYCTTCQHLSGSPFMAWVDIPFSAFELLPSSSSSSPPTSDPPPNCALKPLSSSLATRSICKECGSPISMFYYCDSGSIGVAAGTIDEGSVKSGGMKVTGHIFVAQKPEWYEIGEDGVGRSDGFPEGLQRKVEEWKGRQE